MGRTKWPATYTLNFALGMQLSPALQSLFSFHLWCSYACKKTKQNKKKTTNLLISVWVMIRRISSSWGVTLSSIQWWWVVCPWNTARYCHGRYRDRYSLWRYENVIIHLYRRVRYSSISSLPNLVLVMLNQSTICQSNLKWDRTQSLDNVTR